MTGNLKQAAGQLVSALGIITLMGCSAQPTTPDEQTGSIEQRATVPSGFIDEQVATGLSGLTSTTIAPDGRIFVTEQAGRVRIIKNGALLTTPFLTVSTTSSGERGLESIAFDPNFATNNFVYVYYTATTPAVHNRISRFVANGDVTTGAETVLLDLDNLSAAAIHNGGALNFGKDGKLYVTVGDNATRENAQLMTTTFGKLLRINSDGSIPSDNPFFASNTGIYRAIYAYGLRNPFTFTVQPGTGRMFINDVGETTWEEINEAASGANFGWPLSEGPTPDTRFKAPVYAYGHGTTGTTGCAITGGAFYNPTTVRFPASYVGKYFFADYCSNWINVLDPATGTVAPFATAASGIVDVDVAADGSLYYAQQGGQVRRIRDGSMVAPTIATPPSNAIVSVGQPVTFKVVANGSSPLGYQWQRGTTNIAGATSDTYTFTPVIGDNGATFRAVVSNPFGSVTSSAATLTVTNNQPPTASIVSPAVGTTYAAGTTLNFSGSANDPETGALPASAFTWEVRFHHDEHTHPVLAPTSGIISGSVSLPNRGELSTNVYYEVILTVKDAAGLTTTVTRNVTPRLVNLSLASNPSGLKVLLDSVAVATPSTTRSVEGMIHTLSTESPQSMGSVYTFGSWSDGGAATHEITAPAVSTTYTATFTAGPPPLSRAGWTATASSTGPTDNVQNPLDGNVQTRWATGTAQANGQWYTVDMKAAQTFSQLTIDAAVNETDYPRGFAVYVSNDGTNWGSPIATGTPTTTLSIVTFPAQTARYLRIVQTGSDPVSWWSLAELNVFGSSTPPPTVLSRTGWTATASSTGGTDVPANALDTSTSSRWSAGTAQVNGQWFVVDMKATQAFSQVTLNAGNANDYPHGYQLFVSSDGTNWGTAVASGTPTGQTTTITFPPQSARYIRIVQTGTSSSWWSITDLNVYGSGSVPPTGNLPRTGWVGTASSTGGADTPAKALDANSGTRFSTGTPQVNGQWFAVDMQSPQTFSKLTLESGGDYARGYQVFVSADGTNWGTAIATGTGVTGTTTISFASQTARYFRIVQTGSASAWWSLYELNAGN